METISDSLYDAISSSWRKMIRSPQRMTNLLPTTKEKIVYHNGKEFFTQCCAGSAHAPRNAN